MLVMAYGMTKLALASMACINVRDEVDAWHYSRLFASWIMGNLFSVIIFL